MPTTHKYFQDKMALLLLTVNFFLLCLTIILIALRLTSNSGEGFIVQYRSDVGVGAFQTGTMAELLYFIAFALITSVAAAILSFKTYHIKRQLSIAIIGMNSLLLILAIVVSNALLVLR